MLTDEQLDQARLLNDSAFASDLQSIVASLSIDQIAELRPWLADFSNLQLPEHLQELFVKYCNASWSLSKSELLRLQSFYSRFAEEIFMVLGLYSLPYCYAAANGVKVLYRSKALLENPIQRLTETGKFTDSLLNSLENRQAFYVLCFKVRVQHAFIASGMVKSGAWDRQALGMPLNFEDMAGTSLSFSLIVLRGLRKSGITILPEEAEAWLKLWNLQASCIGLPNEYCPPTLSDAFELEKLIANRQFKASDEGKTLAAVLLKSLREVMADKAPFDAAALLHFFLGDEICALLGLPLNKNGGLALQVFITQKRILSPFRQGKELKPYQFSTKK